MIFKLPEHINSSGLIPFLGQLSSLRDTRNVTFDFSGLQRVSPASLAAITAWTHYRQKKHFETKATGLAECAIHGYLQRMNLLDYCGWKHEPEDFNRHPPLNRFIPLEEVPVDVDDLGDRFASCIAPGGDEYGHPLSGLWDAAYYLITELANNIRQHSGGRGFLVAQTTARDGFVRIALADCGSGIPESLRSSGITAELPLSDAQNILKALEPRVSTKGQPSNEGVGFTLCARVTQLLKGAMLIHSQRGLVTCNSEGDRQTRTPMGGEGFPGTLITLVIPTADAEQFDARLEDAKNLEGLLRTTGRPAKFFT